VPVLRPGSAAPPAISTSSPVYLALWTKPAELVPVWLAGKNKTWLSVGGQIVNLSGKTLRIAGFQVVLTIDGKVVVDQPVTAQMNHFVPSATDSDRKFKAVAPPVDGVQELTDFATYFVDGFEVAKAPSSFKNASLRLILNYKIGNRCGAAVLDAPVVRLDPLIARPPLDGKWNFENSTTHHGFDGHSWPAQRFSVDFTKLDDKGKSFKDAKKMDQNSNFYAYGETIHAIASGVVVEEDDTHPENAGTKTLKNPAVNYILIQHNPGKSDSFFHGYYHVRTGKNNKKKVIPGKMVRAGDELGQVGNAGGSSEPHLHLGVIRMDATGRGTMVPMAFKNLKDGSDQTVTDVPGTGEYSHLSPLEP